jgi:hypothetical protein
MLEGVLYAAVLLATIVGVWASILCGYMFPTIRAFQRGHPQRWRILLLNASLGWTVAGWIASFIWAKKVADRGNDVGAPNRDAPKITT